MKSQNSSPRNNAGKRDRPPMRIPNIPMEWMDPMSWRLPSGKALAEFALQTGFLAPLMMRAPKMHKKPGTAGVPVRPVAVNPRLTREQVEEAPVRSASFR